MAEVLAETHKQVVSIKPDFAATVLWAATQSSSTQEGIFFYIMLVLGIGTRQAFYH